MLCVGNAAAISVRISPHQHLVAGRRLWSRDLTSFRVLLTQINEYLWTAVPINIVHSKNYCCWRPAAASAATIFVRTWSLLGHHNFLLQIQNQTHRNDRPCSHMIFYDFCSNLVHVRQLFSVNCASFICSGTFCVCWLLILNSQCKC